MKIEIQHMQGVAGHAGRDGEKAVETHYAEVESEAEVFDAIRYVAGDLDGWREKKPQGTVVKVWSIENPDAANRSGDYCDYWMAVVVEGDDV